MTDLDLVRAELELAASDENLRDRLARELHHLRLLRSATIARGRRTPPRLYEIARTAPRPVELDPPPERGSQADLLRRARA